MTKIINKKSHQKLINSSISKKKNSNINIYDKPIVFGYDEADKELEYIKNYFAQCKNKEDNLGGDNSVSKNNSLKTKRIESYQNKNNLTITTEEKNTIIQAIQFNNSYLTFSNGNNTIVKSLYKKGFAEKSNGFNNLFRITKNVQMLIEIDGLKVFDEIIKN